MTGWKIIRRYRIWYNSYMWVEYQWIENERGESALIWLHASQYD